MSSSLVLVLLLLVRHESTGHTHTQQRAATGKEEDRPKKQTHISGSGGEWQLFMFQGGSGGCVRVEDPAGSLSQREEKCYTTDASVVA